MAVKPNLNAAYKPSEDVVAREIEGEIIIVPLVAGVGDLEDALFSLNETGKAIWKRLDGKRKLKDVVADLCAQYQTPAREIRTDVLGLVQELLKRRMLVEASKA